MASSRAFQKNLQDILLYEVSLSFIGHVTAHKPTKTWREDDDHYVDILKEIAELYELEKDSLSACYANGETIFENSVRQARRQLKDPQAQDFEPDPSDWALTPKGWQRLRTFLANCFYGLQDSDCVRFTTTLWDISTHIEWDRWPDSMQAWLATLAEKLNERDFVNLRLEIEQCKPLVFGKHVAPFRKYRLNGA